MQVNGHKVFESKKNIHRQNQIKPCGSWRYIDVLYTKLNYIYFTSDTGNVQLSWAHSQHSAHSASTTLEHRCIYVNIDLCVSRPIETVGNEESMYISLCARARYASHAGCCGWAQDSWTLPVSEVKNDINTVQFLAQTDCFVYLGLNVSSRAAWFNLVLSVYVFLSQSRGAHWLALYDRQTATVWNSQTTSWMPWG